MRLAIIVVGLVLWAGVGSAAPMDTTQVRLWRDDLRFLRAEMPARHANLFHAMTRAQFDSACTAIDGALPRLARHQVVVELMKLDALVGDGHSNVSPWRDSAAAFHELPIELYAFEDGLFIRAATAGHRDLVGERVVAVGGVPVAEALARIGPLVSRDNAMGPRAWAPLLLSMPEVLHAVGLAPGPDGATFTLERGGRRHEVTLAPIGPYPLLGGEIDRTWSARPGWVDARDGAPAPPWLARDDVYWFRWLDRSRTLYCQVNAIQQQAGDSLQAFFARAVRTADSAGAERFVLDLRRNGGGNAQWNRDIVRALVKSRYDAPGRLIVITGRRTWSAAQMLVNELENLADVTFVGEPSASRGNVYGDSRKIVLPNSRLTVRVSSLYWQLSDPRDDRPWVDVGVPAGLTFADYAAGRDPALAAAEAVRP